MSPFLKNLFWAILIFLIISGIFSLLWQPKQTREQISLSQLVQEIEQSNIKQIEVKGEEIIATLNNNEQKASLKETESSLSQSLLNYGLEPAQLQNIDLKIIDDNGGFWLNIFLPAILPLIFIFVFFYFIIRQARRGATDALSFGRSLARVVQPNKKGQTNKKGATFKDVAGLEQAKQELKEVVDFLRHPQKYLRLGARIPKGVLLVGLPGTGKTLLARAVANEAQVPFFHMSGSEFVEMFVGVGASRTRDLFKTAKKHAPAIVFIDELDAIGRRRGLGMGGGHDEREQTLNQILVEMDGFEPDTNIIVLAATNRPDVLDPALLRPGRFDRRVTLDLPDIKDRQQILKIHLKDKPLSANIDIKEIAERTPGFSGADLANLANEAAILAARQNEKKIFQKHLRDSIEKVLLGPERKSHILSTQEKEITAFHETGHALVTAFSQHTDPIHKISIVARGQAAGYTLKLPDRDKSLHSRSEFLDELAVLLAGYAAEKIIFNELTTGAANDLQKASELARKIVTQYGMSDKIGPLSLGQPNDFNSFYPDFDNRPQLSENLNAQIDQEISTLLKQALDKASQILLDKKDILHKIAKRLQEKETIERKEFEKLLK